MRWTRKKCALLCAILGHIARKQMRRNAGTSSLRRGLASGLPRKHPEEARDCAVFTPPFSDTLVNTASSSDSLSHSRIPLHASNSSASPSLRITGLCYSRATLSLSIRVTNPTSLPQCSVIPTCLLCSFMVDFFL
ncbi:hypothetical protein TGGT1_259100 [Toxoplasma gondii GT1]|uniref:Uncharacterized protein n=1 Tax=Toxoplasma gondii (strain ATCC 50853 / GT1) TaxID=507601 RepID=S7UYI1_TOXGG|nr:hypothetical protein TGGT1_259100 [Toxoplasma gondii GT1]